MNLYTRISWRQIEFHWVICSLLLLSGCGAMEFESPANDSQSAMDPDISGAATNLEYSESAADYILQMSIEDSDRQVEHANIIKTGSTQTKRYDGIVVSCDYYKIGSFNCKVCAWENTDPCPDGINYSSQCKDPQTGEISWEHECVPY